MKFKILMQATAIYAVIGAVTCLAICFDKPVVPHTYLVSWFHVHPCPPEPIPPPDTANS